WSVGDRHGPSGSLVAACGDGVDLSVPGSMEITEIMTLNMTPKCVVASILNGLIVAIALGGDGRQVQAQSSLDPDPGQFDGRMDSDNPDATAPPRTLRASTFLDWLLEPENPDGDEEPRTKRGDDFCLVTFAPNQVNVLWSDRPTFIIQGAPRSLVLYRDLAQDPIWEYPVNEAEVVVYTGPPLEPDTVYTFRAQHPTFPSTIYEQRQLSTLSFEDEVLTTMGLLVLEGEMRSAGESEEAIALARADYLWQQGLETDAWATVLPLQDESAEVAAAVQMGYEQWCGGQGE
ncbi:MAG: hypothetical protein F6K30_22785, partial [Cyanothece sp. SIO2G6]|nr:hypothetical protein [Cyanothece sp. SIO2G6]